MTDDETVQAATAMAWEIVATGERHEHTATRAQSLAAMVLETRDVLLGLEGTAVQRAATADLIAELGERGYDAILREVAVDAYTDTHEPVDVNTVEAKLEAAGVAMDAAVAGGDRDYGAGTALVPMVASPEIRYAETSGHYGGLDVDGVPVIHWVEANEQWPLNVQRAQLRAVDAKDSIPDGYVSTPISPNLSPKQRGYGGPLSVYEQRDLALEHTSGGHNRSAHPSCPVCRTLASAPVPEQKPGISLSEYEAQGRAPL